MEDVVGSQCSPALKTEMREARIRKAVLQQLIIIRSFSHLHACFCIALRMRDEFLHVARSRGH